MHPSKSMLHYQNSKVVLQQKIHGSMGFDDANIPDLNGTNDFTQLSSKKCLVQMNR